MLILLIYKLYRYLINYSNIYLREYTLLQYLLIIINIKQALVFMPNVEIYSS